MATKPSVSSKPWQHRLSSDPAPATAELLASLDVDATLYPYDIAGSMAHAKMLRRVGLLKASELRAILKGLAGVDRDLAAGKLPLDISLEDIHMVVESALVARIGRPGRKLHTGRSRNDQVALDLRLWARDQVDTLIELVRRLQRALVNLADKQGRFVMPAYTHLQRAQPILAGQAVLAYVEMLQRDAERLADCRKRINVCPLGSGAVAGTSMPLDRRFVARELGFADITRNSIDATSDRDFLTELCFCLATLGGHLSRWAEDWIIYATTEFGFIELDDAFCTSSSMMPQKKNADTLELIRGKSATAIAALVGMLTLTKGLPLAYNRDLQDDKRFCLPVAAAMRSALTVAAGVVSTAKFRPQKIAATLEAGFLDATSLAEYLVSKGVPFRRAHQLAGGLVARAEKEGKSLSQLPLAQLQAAAAQVGPDVAGWLTPANVVKRYRPEGAAGPRQLDQQIKFWRKTLV